MLVLGKEWDRVYSTVIAALAPQLRDSPRGLAQLAAEIADAVTAEWLARFKPPG